MAPYRLGLPYWGSLDKSFMTFQGIHFVRSVRRFVWGFTSLIISVRLMRLQVFQISGIVGIFLYQLGYATIFISLWEGIVVVFGSHISIYCLRC